MFTIPNVINQKGKYGENLLLLPIHRQCLTFSRSESNSIPEPQWPPLTKLSR